MEEKKDIKVVSGDGSNLDISPVYEHLNTGKPTSSDKKPTNIVIPKENISNSKDKKNKNTSDNSKNN